MKITAADVAEQFDFLITGRHSREEVEAWAEERQRAEDEGRLEYEPRGDEERLWSAVTYLLGVGIRVRSASDAYLHSVADFEEYRRESGF